MSDVEHVRLDDDAHQVPGDGHITPDARRDLDVPDIHEDTERGGRIHRWKHELSHIDSCGYRELAIGLSALCVCLFIALVVVTDSLHHDHSDTEDPAKPSCGGVCGRSGMVSTTNELATQIGLEILKRNGNAVDAAAAVQFALNVVQPQSTGIGGGCLILYHHAASGITHALDGREEAPNNFTSNMYCKDVTCRFNDSCVCTDAWNYTESATGGNAVGVPGTLKAVARLLQEHGTMSLAQVLQPAIDLARNGFPMYEFLRELLIRNTFRLERFPSSAKLFLPNGGKPIGIGETFTNPDLADTFEVIAQKGASEFYSGQIATDIVNAVQGAVNQVTGLRGVMEKADIEGYRAVYRRPINTTYNGYAVHGHNLPGSGGLTLGLMLNLLEQFEMGDFTPHSTEYWHRLIDAQDMAFADRNFYLGDGDWVDVPLDGFISKDYARGRVQNLTHSTRSAGAPVPHGVPPGANPSQFSDPPDSPHHGTTHFSIVDQWGNVVSMTTTIEENLGSAVVVPGRGFLLNNELTDFTSTARASDGRLYANRPEGGKRLRRTALGAEASTFGGKRPLSSMSPTIVLRDGKPFLAIGSPGGRRIIGTVLNVLVPLLNYPTMTLDAATQARRIISLNNEALVETGIASSISDQLSARGFRMVPYVTNRPLGFVQSVLIRLSGELVGTADSTRLPVASAMGY